MLELRQASRLAPRSLSIVRARRHQPHELERAGLPRRQRVFGFPDAALRALAEHLDEQVAVDSISRLQVHGPRSLRRFPLESGVSIGRVANHPDERASKPRPACPSTPACRSRCSVCSA